MTAMASPMARPTPCTIAAAMPLLAAGTETLKTVSVQVAPSARLASSYSFGTAFRAVSDMLMMEGRTMMDRTMMAARRVAPLARPKLFATQGTMMIMPTRP